MKLTPIAKKRWDQIPGNIQVKLLNNAWCSHCRKVVSIGDITGKVAHGLLILQGKCTTCSGAVARVIEGE